MYHRTSLNEQFSIYQTESVRHTIKNGKYSSATGYTTIYIVCSFIFKLGTLPISKLIEIISDWSAEIASNRNKLKLNKSYFNRILLKLLLIFISRLIYNSNGPKYN